MKLVDKEEFYLLPPGTIYSEVFGNNSLGDFKIKQDTITSNYQNIDFFLTTFKSIKEITCYTQNLYKNLCWRPPVRFHLSNPAIRHIFRWLHPLNQ